MSSGETPSVELSSYRDQHFKGTRYEQEKLLKQSCTLYVGNLGKKIKLIGKSTEIHDFSFLPQLSTRLKNKSTSFSRDAATSDAL